MRLNVLTKNGRVQCDDGAAYCVSVAMAGKVEWNC